MKKALVISVFIATFFLNCKSLEPVPNSIEDRGNITFKFIHINDVYEIAPLSGGKYGGMARVAHVRDSVAKVNPYTYMFMAGDFLNPSLLGTIKVDGERLRGRQMIEVMNAMNFELVTFGNHEFDIGEEALQKRLNESNFEWTSSNVLQHSENGESSFKIQRPSGDLSVKDTHIITMMDGLEREVKLGFFGVTVPSNPQDFVTYGDIYSEAERAYSSLDKNVDLIIGLTHLKIDQDIELANRLPNLHFIMGGHEHNSMLVPSNNAVIAKADANAKTIYIHTLTYNKNTKNLKIDSHLMPIDERITSKPEVESLVNKWGTVLKNKLKEVIKDPNEKIYRAITPLDGTDSANRGIQTNLGDILTHAMAKSFNEEVDAALVNGGSIRLDDMLAGDVTSIDIFRILPFGGHVVRADIKGSLLIEVLNFGKASGGTGAYLQRYNIDESETAGWLINGKPVQANNTYTIALSDFLLKGYDIPFLTPDNSGVLEVYEPLASEAASDIRKAVILYLKSIKE